jgi:MinD-like ATPase involved in chromosome partitioning or flagellar assembly
VSRYVLIGRSADYESRLRAIFGLDLASVPADLLASDIAGVVDRLPGRPSVALLGPFLSFEETRYLSEAIPVARPGTAIVVVKGERSELEDWVDAMTIHAVLSPDGADALVESVLSGLSSSEAIAPADPDDVAPAVEVPVEPIPLGADDRPKVIAVASPKGGQGKTTIAINLAAGLAHIAPDSVVLVDADLQFGDVANALDLPATRGWLDAVAAAGDEIAFKAAMHRHPGAFFVLTAPPSPEHAEAISPDRFAAVLAHLARIFRYVVIDTTPGVGEQTLSVLEAADHGVFVSSLSVPSLRALRLELDVLDRAGISLTHRHVVINFVDRVSGLTVKDAERITGAVVGVPIPRSPAVLLASNHGVPLLHHDPRDPAAKAMLDLLATITPAADRLASQLHRRRTR